MTTYAICKIVLVLMGTDPANGANLYERRAECPHETTHRPVMPWANVFHQKELARQCGNKPFRASKECNG